MESVAELLRGAMTSDPNTANGVSLTKSATATPMTEVPDDYGQLHPIESEELIEIKLKEFEHELNLLPEDQLVSVRMADERCPELVTPEFKLMFLRCEVFNTDLAATRYGKYWAKRRELFGDEKAFLPMTLSKAYKDDRAAVEMGYMQLVLGAKDPSGRSIVIIDPSRQDLEKCTRESMTRSMWYMIHASIEDTVTQQRGVCFVVDPRQTTYEQIDRTQIQLYIQSLQGRLPVRLSAVHICHPPYFFALVFPLVSIFMGERLRKRFRVHSEMAELEEFGLTQDILPTSLGGSREMNHQLWVKERVQQGK